MVLLEWRVSGNECAGRGGGRGGPRRYAVMLASCMWEQAQCYYDLRAQVIITSALSTPISSV